MNPTPRIRLKLNPTNVAVPQGYRDLQLDSNGNLVIESPDGTQESVGSGSSATQDAPVAVADATARKLASTYVTAEVTPVNGLRVIQDDLPDVVWTLLDVSDITADANWYGGPRTDASGSLPLSGVRLIGGNNQYSFAEYFAASSSRWLQSSVTNFDVIKLFTGMKIPASLMVAGNKVAFTGSYRYFKSSSGITSDVWLTLGPKAVWDEIEGNAASVYPDTSIFPRASIAVLSADTEGSGFFHAVFTLTAVTGHPTELYLVADTNFADGGATTSVNAAAAFSTLPQPQSATDTTAPLAHFVVGEEAEINIGIIGANNAKTKDWRVAVAGGVNVFVP